MDKKQQIIEEIKRVATQLGKNTLSKKEFQQHAKISLTSVCYYFGVWNEATRKAGLSPIDSKDTVEFSRRSGYAHKNGL